MSDSTHGIRLQSRSQALRAAIELLSSMRFAIALLTVICIASVIGTVLKQHEPAVNYVNQFGPFWAEVFLALHLNAVYSAWWFLLILAFLVVSTSLCVARNAPRYLSDVRNYKESLREQSLGAFAHRAENHLPDAPEAAARRLGALLVSGGWKVRLQQRGDRGWMVAAKAGAANKIGYIAAHSAIVLICLGGLLDGDLVVRAQMWLGGKTPYAGGGLISEVKPEHRLSERNPTFRGNLLVAEGMQSSIAILNQSDGVLLQELPFSIELKKFIVEHYSTGMPKLFASDIVIHDKATGEATAARVEVNHPASWRGIEIYQSSFDDGGSQVTLQARPLVAGVQPFEVQGVIGGSSPLPAAAMGQPLTLEYAALRVLNVENFSGAKEPGAAGATGSAVDVRKVDLRSSIESRLGAGNKTVTPRDLRNVGPSITYKLRDASGQAREFNNFMLPVDTGDGQPVYLLGVRETPAEPFRYLRVPADDQGSMDGFVRMRLALADGALREQAVKRYVALAVDPSRPELAEQLGQSAVRALALFAGALPSSEKSERAGRAVGGLQAISDFMEANVPEAERARAGEVLVRILNGTLFELAQLTRQRAGQPPLEQNARTQAFMTQAVLSLSDAQIYPAPVAFELKGFNQVQASVFQVARAPGKNVVYLGCLFLIVGIFAMLYVRERRIWIWLAPEGEGAHATMALSTNRKTLDGDREFGQLTRKLIGAPPHGDTA
ncbi:cytochrome c biogenesis protein ResB [Acidovorax sp. Leaf160]|uniref:cytochrome c biogenesis protein ResB n=1 Tax=Acidovorax sp. Leaf160 TaxID=1736280 RepID=UPI0006F4135D|nr:cytochrome c biogenesis protein ResB [Acidovorax sp. Leaf160]KQR45090.1 cytochrome C biogenesis protein ResB [Acidovorax sp. Leaf160]